ncbi:hypothetical protein GGF31_008224, partial [Allomyces arbusculus]
MLEDIAQDDDYWEPSPSATGGLDPAIEQAMADAATTAATSWWRFYPGVLKEYSDSRIMDARIDMDAGTRDSSMLGRWDQITDEDFFALELPDPCLQRVVRPNPVALDSERTVDSIVVELPGPNSLSEVQWMLAADAVLFKNERCVWVNVQGILSAMKRNENVPRLGYFLSEGASSIRSWLLAEQLLLYVPTTAEANVAEVGVPDEFHADLFVHQQRTLGWLVNLERDRAARTLWIRQPPPTTTED